jgi:hypothetical protein
MKGIETDNSAVKGKAYWKIGGTLLPNVTAWFEMKGFDGVQSVWAQDSTGKVKPDAMTGLSQLFGGFVTDPVNYLGGGNPFLNSIKTGLDTPQLVWETGYGYAKPQHRTALVWETLQDQDGGNGYMRFDLGPELQKIGAYKLELTLAPNRMAGPYAFFGWVDLSNSDFKVDFQYDMKSAEQTALYKIFNVITQQDFILGARTKVAGIELTAEGLANLYGGVGFAADKHLAGELRGVWSLPADLFGLTLAYRYTGSSAISLYGDNDSSESDTIGTQGTQRVLFNVYGKPADLLKIGADTKATLTTASMASNAVELYAKPYVSLDMQSFIAMKSSLDVYGKLNYNLKPGYAYDGSGSAFVFGEAGAKFTVNDPIPGTVKATDLYIGWNNWEKDKHMATLVGQARMAKDLNVELGLGYRAVRGGASAATRSANNPFAFSVGGSWRTPLAEIKNPVLFGAFAYNMDPYDITNGSSDATASLNMTDYIINGGVGKRDGQAQLRVMLKWDF